MRKHGHRKTVTHAGGISSKDPRHTFNPTNLDDGKEGGRIKCKECTEFATERNSTLRTADDNLKARQTLDSICSDKVRKTLSIKCSGIGAVRGTTHVQVSAGVLCIPEEHSSHAHVCNSPDNGFFKTVNALLYDGSGKDLPVEQIAKDLDAVLLDLQQSGRRCCLRLLDQCGCNWSRQHLGVRDDGRKNDLEDSRPRRAVWQTGDPPDSNPPVSSTTSN